MYVGFTPRSCRILLQIQMVFTLAPISQGYIMPQSATKCHKVPQSGMPLFQVAPHYGSVLNMETPPTNLLMQILILMKLITLNTHFPLS
jgi:hypothetical protein